MKHSKSKFYFLFIFILITIYPESKGQNSNQNNKSGIIAIQSDLGVKNASVATLKAVILKVNPEIQIIDVTHEIPAFNIWEAAFLLDQSFKYFPANSIFISIVDPNIGSNEASLIVKTENNRYIIAPNNGTLSLLKESVHFDEVRVIDPIKNTLPGAEEIYSFIARDIYAYTAARLISGEIKFSDIGPVISSNIIEIEHQVPFFQNGEMKGCIVGTEENFGNVWTNISNDFWKSLNILYGDFLDVKIYAFNEKIYSGIIPFVPTFSSVEKGRPLAYINDNNRLAFAINLGNFSKYYGIYSGPNWTIKIKKINKK